LCESGKCQSSIFLMQFFFCEMWPIVHKLLGVSCALPSIAHDHDLQFDDSHLFLKKICLGLQ